MAKSRTRLRFEDEASMLVIPSFALLNAEAIEDKRE